LRSKLRANTTKNIALCGRTARCAVAARRRRVGVMHPIHIRVPAVRPKREDAEARAFPRGETERDLLPGIGPCLSIETVKQLRLALPIDAAQPETARRLQVRASPARPDHANRARRLLRAHPTERGAAEEGQTGASAVGQSREVEFRVAAMGRSIRYARKSVDSWISARARRSTSDTGAVRDAAAGR